MRHARLPCWLFVVVAEAACRGGSPPLDPVYPTKEALAQAVVDAMTARDVARLHELAVSRTEFTTHIWPQLPASKGGLGMPVEYAWADTEMKSRGYLAVTLADIGGQSWTVTAIAFGRPPADYGGFRIHPDAKLSMRNASGQLSERRLFGSMIETPTGWKLSSYIGD